MFCAAEGERPCINVLAGNACGPCDEGGRIADTHPVKRVDEHGVKIGRRITRMIGRTDNDNRLSLWGRHICV
jgi:hypothetical protein